MGACGAAADSDRSAAKAKTFREADILCDVCGASLSGVLKKEGEGEAEM